MKLDSRIIEGKKPLTALDTEEVKQFIGKEGYFADCLAVFTNIKCNKDMLKAIDEKAQRCFEDADGVCWDYFLPSEWVDMGEPEKKWRPFSLTEWRHIYAIGDEIVFRIKDSDTVRAFMFCGLYSDHDDDLPGKGVISLGSELFVLQNLFDQFELRKNNEWQPFGVLIEGDEK